MHGQILALFPIKEQELLLIATRVQVVCTVLYVNGQTRWVYSILRKALALSPL